MYCNQCGKEIPKTNTHAINYNGVSMIVCGKHYTQYIKYGHFLDNNPKSIQDSNEYEITPEGVWIYTFKKSTGDPSGKFLIDLDDIERVLAHKWRFWKGDYFTGNTKPITINRFIMNINDPNLVVDHKNGLRYDNRKENLRVTTQQKNLCNKALLSNNKSEFAGVYWDKDRYKWVAEIRFNNVKCQLGRFDKKEDAVFARYFAETQIFREFRSDRNDDKIYPYIDACDHKMDIIDHVFPKIARKYDIHNI